jgi:hypothetical protein
VIKKTICTAKPQSPNDMLLQGKRVLRSPAIESKNDINVDEGFASEYWHSTYTDSHAEHMIEPPCPLRSIQVVVRDVLPTPWFDVAHCVEQGP